MLDGASKIAQRDSEPAVGHLTLVLLDAYLNLKLNVDEDKSSDDCSNDSDSETCYTNTIPVMKLEASRVPPNETSYHERAKESKSYDDLKDVAKQWDSLILGVQKLVTAKSH